MKFTVKTLGNASGTILLNDISYEAGIGASFEIELEQADKLRISSNHGKFSDTEDSFLFIYATIDPFTENGSLSADFQIKQDLQFNPNWLSGYGLLAADTTESSGKNSLFRNSLAIGRYRTNTFHEFGCGLRIISGYADPDTTVSADRKRDISRSGSNDFSNPLLQAGEIYSFLLSKDDKGFAANARHNDNAETFSFPGSDFLTFQDPHIYIGMAVAGNLTVDITNIKYKVQPGSISHTPDNAIQSTYIEYPFSASLIKSPSIQTHVCRTVIYVSPEGTPESAGTKEDPTDLQSALDSQNVKKILLADGIYTPKTSFCIGKNNSGRPKEPKILKASHSRKAIIDGSLISKKTPAMILNADYWHVEGIVFRNAPSSGLFISGSHNVIDDCEALMNNDAGLLVCAFPNSPKTEWPESNLIAFCDSHDNADLAMSDADGFGAKLSVGGGNCFYECAAFNNADDGFDLFTKRTIGMIGEVRIENCIAAKNRGSGFKFGGENQPVNHHIYNSLAYGNKCYGFTANSNPLSELKNLVSWKNGNSVSLDSYSFQARTVSDPKWICENIIPLHSEQIATETVRKHNKALDEEQASLSFESFDMNAPVTRSGKLIDIYKILKLKAKLATAFFSSNSFFKRAERRRRYSLLKNERQN